MASSQTGFILNVLRRANLRFVFPIRLHTGLANCSIKSDAVKSKRIAKSEADYHIQKSIVADFVEKGNLVGLDLVREQVLKAGETLNKFTFDAHFIGICSELGAFELGRDFFRVLYSEGSAGMVAIGRYFALCHDFPNKFGPPEQEFLLKVYDELLEKYDVLDVSTCEAVAQGIGLTERWRSEIPRLLDMVRHSDTSPSPTLWMAAIESAFYHQDHTVAWEYMDLYAQSGKQIIPKLFEIVLKQKSILPQLLRNALAGLMYCWPEHPHMEFFYYDQTTEKRLEISFFKKHHCNDNNKHRWLERHGIILNVESANIFMRLASSQSATAKSSLVSRKGLCKACHRTLQPSTLSPEEFEHLRSAFLDPVLVGKDVFQKTRPEELKSFHTFLDKVLPVDVVLDGLNIAYVSKKHSPNGSKLLRFMTSHFVSEGRKILVIGRQHMNNWSAKEMNYVKSHASVFLAENNSQDDPFLLYAALKSGMGTNFVSRDRMTGHKFLLGRPHLQHIFSKWQALHQYHPLHISPDGNSVALRLPTVFAREPQQTSEDVWHLPVVDHSQTNVEGHLQDETAPWLCVLCIPSNPSQKAHRRDATGAQT